MDATDTIALIAREQIIAYSLALTAIFFEWLHDEIIIAGGWRTRSITAIISRKVTRIWKTDYG